MTAEALAVAAACGVAATSAESLYEPAVSATRGVWRVAERGGRTAVVKVLQPVAGGGPWGAELDPAAPYYWRREADVYAAGPLGGGLALPALYGVVDLDGGAAGLCVEDVAAAYLPSPWPVAAYARVAAATAHLPSPGGAPWLSRGWLPAYVARHERDAAHLDRELPGVDPAVAAALTRLWHERPLFLGWLRHVPETLCHFDLSVENVFAAADPPVAIDWAYAGIGPAGADAGPLALESALDFHLPPEGVPEVTAATHDAYVAATGGDTARLGLCASAAVKFAWVFPALLAAVAQGRATLNGRPLVEAVPVWSACLPHLAALAAEARRHAAALRLPGA